MVRQMKRLNAMSLYMDGNHTGTTTDIQIGIDLASKPDYTAKTLVHKHGATLSFISLSKTLNTLQQVQQHFVQKTQKQNRQLLPGTYISTLST